MSTAQPNWLTLEGASFGTGGFAPLWLVAAATYGVGDVVTTLAIVYVAPTLTEANPVVRLAFDAFGGGGFLGLKLLVLFACIGISLWGGLLDDDPVLFYGPPAVLTLVGVVVTGLNLGLLFG